MKRFLLLGLDGAEPSLVQQFMDDGDLPHLHAIASRGAFLPCQSTVPPATFPAWTTCVTGVNPGQHGICDFTAMTQGTYQFRFVNSTWRSVPALWNILSDAGKRVCVAGVPATYPPEPVNGCMVAGFDSPVCTGIDASFVYPREWYPLVKDWPFADFQETDLGPGWHAEALRKLHEGIARKEAILLRLLEQEAWDFVMAVFGESDSVSHHFWLFHDPLSPRYRPGFEDAIRGVYRRLDEAVGRIVEAAGEDMIVGVVSDHGFGGAGTGVVHMNQWLSEQGDLRWSDRRRGGILKKAALRVAPESWRGALFRRFGGLAARAESQSRTAGIDWEGTRAWSEELNYFPGVRINLAGREPMGVVAPEEYEAYRADLCQRLAAWHPVARAWPREALYSGPHVERAPDIILELALEDGYSHSYLRSHGPESFRRITPDEYVGGKERGMTGNHRPTGILMLSEPVVSGGASLLDVAPTVLAAMEVAGPPMEGTPLLGEYEECGALAGVAATAPARYSDADESELARRLRNLGYFE